MVRRLAKNQPVRLLCELFDMSRSAFYYHAKPQRINVERLTLIAMIKQAFYLSKQSAGARTIASIVTDWRGKKLTRYLAGKLMKANHLVSTQPVKHRYHKGKGHVRHDNVLGQQFYADRPNQVWAGDVTYIRTKQGWRYLAVVLDLFSRNVVGFAMSTSPDSELTISALRMAYESRKCPTGVLFHSDQGSHYTSLAFEKQIKAFYMKHSMSRRGNCYDNAPTERFFRSLKSEWIMKTAYADIVDMRNDITAYILGYYRKLRPHTFNNQLTPEKKEQLFYKQNLLKSV